MVFKKDLTPIGGKRGVVDKVAGKGSAVRQPQVLPQITGRYPSQPRQAPTPAPTPPAPLPYKEP